MSYLSHIVDKAIKEKLVPDTGFPPMNLKAGVNLTIYKNLKSLMDGPKILDESGDLMPRYLVTRIYETKVSTITKAGKAAYALQDHIAIEEWERKTNEQWKFIKQKVE